MMNRHLVAARILTLVHFADRAGCDALHEQDIGDLSYFVDAFGPLWSVQPIQAERTKGGSTRTAAVRDALDLLVVGRFVEPHDVRVVEGELNPTFTPTARFSAVMERLAVTRIGRLEMACAQEVALAAAVLMDGRMPMAVRLDATMSTGRLGPNDVADFTDPTSPTTSAMASRFRGAAVTNEHTVAELTHLYMQHLDRSIPHE